MLYFQWKYAFHRSETFRCLIVIVYSKFFEMFCLKHTNWFMKEGHELFRPNLRKQKKLLGPSVMLQKTSDLQKTLLQMSQVDLFKYLSRPNYDDFSKPLDWCPYSMNELKKRNMVAVESGNALFSSKLLYFTFKNWNIP